MVWCPLQNNAALSSPSKHLFFGVVWTSVNFWRDFQLSPFVKAEVTNLKDCKMLCPSILIPVKNN